MRVFILRRVRSACSVFACAFVMFGCVAGSTNNTVSLSPESGEGVHKMPQVELADLEGRTYQFPKDLPAPYTLLVMGFAHEQREITETWRSPLRELASSSPELKTFEVPVIDNSTLALRAIIRNGMRTGISSDVDRKETLTLFVDRPNFLEVLGIQDDTRPCAILFDRAGSVLWREYGTFTEEKLASLRDALGQ